MAAPIQRLCRNFDLDQGIQKWQIKERLLAKGRGKFITTQLLKFSIKSYKTAVLEVGGFGVFPVCFHLWGLKGLEGTCCSNKGSLLPFDPWHKDDIKCTPASCHVNESKSNNAQRAAKQPSLLSSATWAFNLCTEIPGTAKSQGCFTRTSPHRNK